MAFGTFDTVAQQPPRFIDTNTIAAACIPRWAVSALRSRGATRPAHRQINGLHLVGDQGPTRQRGQYCRPIHTRRQVAGASS